MKLFVELLALAAVWGASFLFLRISSPEFGPVALIFVRTGIAALVLMPFIFLSGQTNQIFDEWGKFLFVGAVSTAVPFCLFAYTTLYLSAGHTSILNATTPFFSAVIAYYWLAERLSKVGLIGLFVGFSGVYFLSAYNADVDEAIAFWPIASALFATFLYAYSSSFVKVKMSHLKPLVVAAGSQLFSAMVLLPFAIFLWPEEMPSTKAWVSVFSMGVFSTALALIVFFRLLQRVGVTKTVAVTYLIPVFGLGWGNLFLDEVVTKTMIFGGGLVLLGVALTTGAFENMSWLRKRVT